MKWDKTISIFAVIAAALALGALGCAEIPREPEMRPIPPPPPTPPPGVVYAPQAVYSTNPPSAIMIPPPGGTVAAIANTNQAGFEVSSNFVANPQAVPGQAASAPVATTTAQPQYEIVPPRPGLDYVWHNGFWRWNGNWEWQPGEWVYQPPQVIIVPEPGWGYPYRFGPRPYPRYYPHRRHWR